MLRVSDFWCIHSIDIERNNYSLLVSCSCIRRKRENCYFCIYHIVGHFQVPFNIVLNRKEGFMLMHYSDSINIRSEILSRQAIDSSEYHCVTIKKVFSMYLCTTIKFWFRKKNCQKYHSIKKTFPNIYRTFRLIVDYQDFC